MGAQVAEPDGADLIPKGLEIQTAVNRLADDDEPVAGNA
jgi:hypothetical protein